MKPRTVPSPLGAALRLIGIVALATLLAGCGFFGVSRSDLIGDFLVDYGYGVETLRLNNDGKYTQLIRLKDEDNWTTQSGTWQFNDAPSAEVVLDNALQIDDGSGKPRADWQKPVAGVRNLPVKKEWRTVSLVVDGARGLHMTKLAPPTPSKRKPDIIHLPPSGDVEVK